MLTNPWHPLAILRRKIRMFGLARYCPICRSSVKFFLPHGHLPRPDAECPVCASLERHRLVWMFFKNCSDLFDGRLKRLLHIAPEYIFAINFKKVKSIRYVSADLRARDAMMRMDITALPFHDSVFDVVYCSHVLEHVADDCKAMREVYRVLNRCGWAVLQVPITAKKTIEDPSVSDPDERLRLFGHPDHVRRYGPDYVQRLADSGFQVNRYATQDIVARRSSVKMGIRSRSGIFYCRKQ